MDVLAAPSFRTAQLLWQPRPGAFMLTVICKATFVLLPGTSTLADEPEPPNETDDHWDDDELRSLHAATDRVPFKRRADVLLIGHAYAPRRQPVSSLVARLLVGSMDKAIEVCADRAWTQEGQLREGSPFLKMPLRWERAAGGPETSNPVGMRADARPDRYGQVAIPNLQAPGSHVARQGEVIAPVGFGPVAPWWPERKAKLHRHATVWNHRAWWELPLPEDVDAAFFNAAPTDQQADELRSDERIVLENLHPEHTRLVTSLPGVSPRAMVERAGAGPQALRLRCDTLCIDTDRGVCSLVWRGQVPLSRADEQGRVTISAVGGESADRDEAVQTLVGGMRAGAALPFGGAVGADLGSMTMQLVGGVVGAAALPFQEASPWAVALAGAASEAEQPALEGGEDGTGTVFGLVTPKGEVLPFAGARAEAVAPVVVAPVVQVLSFLRELEVKAAPRAEAEAVAPTEAPPPPAMIGPLATAEMVESERAEAADEGRPTAPMAAVVMAPKEELALPLAEFPIERCAAIAAAMARRKGDRAKILEENELTAVQWKALNGRWAEAIRGETRRGRTGLMEAYDRAYVGRLEEERGPIMVEEYARLVVATERGMASEVLAELALPKGAAMRIERVWLEKLSDDSKLEGSVGTAVEAAREEGT